MMKIIVFTHGALAGALKESASMLVGNLDNVECFSVTPGCDLDALREQVSACIAAHRQDGVIVFSDLFFGTPFNILINLSQEQTFPHITGVNLPLLIEAVNYSRRRNVDIEQVARELMEFSRDCIKDAGAFIASLPSIL